MASDEDILEWLGANVRRVRRRRGLTQDQLAAALKMKDSRYIQRVEAATINITIGMLARLARVLDVRPGELIRVAPPAEKRPGKPPPKKRTK